MNIGTALGEWLDTLGIDTIVDVVDKDSEYVMFSHGYFLVIGDMVHASLRDFAEGLVDCPQGFDSPMKDAGVVDMRHPDSLAALERILVGWGFLDNPLVGRRIDGPSPRATVS